MKLGDRVAVVRAFTQAEVAAYSRLGGPTAAPGLAPDPLIGALFSYLLGVRLPGPGTNYLKQETEYLRPARIGELLTAEVEVTRIRPDKHLIDLAVTCRGAAGDTISRGRALVHADDVAARQED